MSDLPTSCPPPITQRPASLRASGTKQDDGQVQPIRSTPPMYARSASGTVIEPSAFW